MKINIALLAALAVKAKREAALVEGPRLALYLPMPGYEIKAPAAKEAGIWECKIGGGE